MKVMSSSAQRNFQILFIIYIFLYISVLILYCIWGVGERIRAHIIYCIWGNNTYLFSETLNSNISKHSDWTVRFAQ